MARTPDENPTWHNQDVQRELFAADAARGIADLPVVETVVEPPAPDTPPQGDA